MVSMARIKLPEDKLWPAFWLWCDLTRRTVSCGKINIMENGGDNPETSAFAGGVVSVVMGVVESFFRVNRCPTIFTFSR